MEMGKVAMLMVVAMVMVAGLVEGQTNACASALTPCQPYLNSTNPPASCCDPLKQAVVTQLQCLCGILNNPTLLTSLRINITQAQELPQHCGMPNTAAACAQSPSSSATPPPPPPPGSGVGKLTWNGVSSLVVLSTSIVVIRDLLML